MAQARFGFARVIRVVVAAAGLAGMAVLLIIGTTSAAPAAPITIELRQPDGAVFLGRQYGDERAHGWETLDGHTILRDRTGTWRYAFIDAGGALQPGAVRADRAAPFFVLPHLRPAQSTTAQSTRTRATAPPVHASVTRTGAGGAIPAGAVTPALSPNLGDEPVLVLLVRFTNQAPSARSTAVAWHDKFFGSSNSVADFYDQNSYGQLELVPATESYGTANDGIVGWLSLSSNHPNSADNVGASANEKVVRKAIKAARSYVDYASYDADHDGFISTRELHVTIILAGYEASYDTNCGNSIWGHQSALYGNAVSVDGVTVGDAVNDGGYTMFGEQHCTRVGGQKQSHLATIGIMAHELAHDLDLPDLYDIDYSTWGVGEWSLMSLGVWNSLDGKPSGSSPAMFDAWSKWAGGWLTPVRGAGDISLPPAESSPVVFQLLKNPGAVDWSFAGPGKGQYFLVEYRETSSYDAALPSCGVLIWHIDETQWDNGNDSRRLVDVEEADGKNQLDKEFGVAGNPGDAGDVWPGSRNRTTFNNTSSPNSKLYNGSSSGIALTTIAVPCNGANATFKAVVPDTGVPNDQFAQATSLGGGTSASIDDASNVGATREVDEPHHAGKTGGASIWYDWTPAADGTVTIDTIGSSIDTLLAVYTGNFVSGLTEVASNDDFSGGQSQVTFAAASGTTYHIAVDGLKSGGTVATGDIQLHLSKVP